MAGMRVGVLTFGLLLTILPMGATRASAAAEVLAACSAPPPTLGKYQPARPGTLLPAVPFVDADGTDRPLDGLRGEGLVVNVWATWCAPCVEEMPALDQLAAQTKQTGVRVVALSADREGAAVVRRFYEVNGVRNLPGRRRQDSASGPRHRHRRVAHDAPLRRRRHRDRPRYRRREVGRTRGNGIPHHLPRGRS